MYDVFECQELLGFSVFLLCPIRSEFSHVGASFENELKTKTFMNDFERVFVVFNYS